jgi:hypothetical protein
MILQGEYQSMPSFIVPMAIRYVLVSIGVTIALIVAVGVLSAYGFIGDKPPSLAFVVVLTAGMWAGDYFGKKAGRVAEWSEALRISGVLSGLQLLLSAVLTLFFVALPGSELAGLHAAMTPGLLAVLSALFVFIAVIYWVATAAFIRMGSKSALKAKKA